jgi:hypothetical protein
MVWLDDKGPQIQLDFTAGDELLELCRTTKFALRKMVGSREVCGQKAEAAG